MDQSGRWVSSGADPVRARRSDGVRFHEPRGDGAEPYYQEFLRPHKLGWFGAVKVGDGEDSWCLSIQRSIEQGPFQQSEIDRLATLSSQLGAPPPSTIPEPSTWWMLLIGFTLLGVAGLHRRQAASSLRTKAPSSRQWRDFSSPWGPPKHTQAKHAVFLEDF